MTEMTNERKNEMVNVLPTILFEKGKAFKGMKFLYPEQIIRIQSKVEKEQNHMVNENSLHAITAKFLQGYYSENSVYDNAVMYFRDLVEKHIFQNGNKRVAIIAAILYLEVNGYYVWRTNQHVLYDVIMRFFETRNTDELKDYLMTHSKTRTVFFSSWGELNYHLDRTVKEYDYLLSRLALT